MNPRTIPLIFLLGLLPVTATALTLSQDPMFLASTQPRVMLVASKDHQLSVKAYTDYSDLDNDGVLDTTYKDSITYYGYFDPNKCYSYTSSRFEPAAAVTSGTHQCNGSTWSGNFMNWASMTRMDVLRKTFYGGYRSTDTSGASAVTVLERHFLPDDVHAFVKVYNPGSAATLSLYIPSSVVGANTSLSLCNVSNSNSSTLTGQLSLPDPKIRVAAGSWPQWDSSEVTQCALSGGTQPAAVIADYNARVKVCDSTGGTETNCKTYTHPSTSVQTVKPVGLLQIYGDVDADRRVRFGLMTGSYGKNKSGGVLRKNTTFVANNNGATLNSSSSCSTSTSSTTVNGNANDEIDVCTGQFINQASTQAGIINTLNRLRIAGFKYSTNKHEYSCNSPGITSFSDGQCVDWGNPLSEIYQESLKYFAGLSPASAFDAFSGSPTDTTVLSSIPQVTWADPLPATEWCALSSIVVLSTGLNSFDTDQLASFTPTGGTAVDAASLTQTVGDSSHENINGGSYLIGDNGSTANNQCTAKTVSNLATAKGICPEVPSTQGGYGIAGLAYGAKTIDMRPGYATLRDGRWGGATPINSDWALRQPINTYAVQLAESLPSFSPAVGTGTVTLLPACQAYSGTPGAWTTTSTGWRNCSMTNLIVDANVAMASVGSDATAKTNTCSGNGTTSQCFTVPWEDSTWGNDYDMDGIQRLGYCVGTACATFKMLCPSSASANATVGPWAGISAGEVVIATCAVQAQAGHSLTFGYTVTGTTADGASFPIYRPGGSNFNVGQVKPAAVTAASAVTYTQGSSSAALLKNPLWYAAKYGGFTESTPATGTPNPDLTSEWDANGDGVPDSYYDVKNPANLITAMASIFDAASQPDASAASVATNSTNLKIESRVFQAKFSSADWSGQLLSFKINTSGTLSTTAEWDAGSIINGQNPTTGRVILTKGNTGDGTPFSYASLTTAQQTYLNKNNTQTVTDNCGPERVAYLRGDASHESATGTFACASTTTINNFRERSTSKLGDVVNSNPWYVGVPSAGYSDVDHPGYSAFRSSVLTRTPVVYVAGNDGMLHGFDASLDTSTVPDGVPTANSGKEVLAYVPSAIYPNLSWLTDKTYNKNHRYFVDGSPMVGEADVDSSTANDWRSILVGSLGAGGKGYYALDVTAPSSFSQSGTAPADTLLWEFDETDMGFAFNHPPASLSTNQPKQIVKMANGKWAVIVGNGYNSASGKAVLYVLFIEEGMDGTWSSGDFVKIVAEASGNNGLSTPVPFDSDGDGIVDVVYAGDLKGNMWKFLVGNANPLNWQVAFSSAGCTTCTPLFTATDSGGSVQPIIWPPDVTVHPNGGVMVLFGTGKYLEPGDNSTTSDQTFYGIWDKNDGSTTVAGRAAELLQQTVTTVVSATAGNFRIPSTNTINWRTPLSTDPANCSGSCTPSHMGWYMDLPTSGERTTGIPKLENGIIYFNTFIPSTLPCDAGGTGWLMTLDYRNGGNPSFILFDVNGDGTIDAADVTALGGNFAGGFQVGAALGGTTLIRGASLSTYGVGVSSLTSGVMNTSLINFGAGARGRVNWREIVR